MVSNRIFQVLLSNQTRCRTSMVPSHCEALRQRPRIGIPALIYVIDYCVFKKEILTLTTDDNGHLVVNGFPPPLLIGLSPQKK